MADRLAAKIDRSDTAGCWLWTGKLDRGGYGTIIRGQGDDRQVRVHRAVYELAFGPIPSELVVDHLCHVGACAGICDHRRCCNPAHLGLTTIAGNTLRSAAERQGRVTACRNGHPMPENRRAHRDGRTFCESCRKEWAHLSYLRRKGRAPRPGEPVPVEYEDAGHADPVALALAVLFVCVLLLALGVIPPIR